MSINNSLQSNIRHADTKIGMLAVACSAMVIAMLTQTNAVRDAAQRPNQVRVIALVAWVQVLGAIATQMIRAVRPRLDAPGPVITWR